MREKRKSSPRHEGSRFIIAIGVVAMTMLVGVYGALTLQKQVTSNIVSQYSGMASTGDGQGPTTIIVSTPNADDCRRYQLDLATGLRSERGPINCDYEGGNQPGRLETISRAFRNR